MKLRIPSTQNPNLDPDSGPERKKSEPLDTSEVKKAFDAFYAHPNPPAEVRERLQKALEKLPRKPLTGE